MPTAAFGATHSLFQGGGVQYPAVPTLRRGPTGGLASTVMGKSKVQERSVSQAAGPINFTDLLLTVYMHGTREYMAAMRNQFWESLVTTLMYFAIIPILLDFPRCFELLLSSLIEIFLSKCKTAKISNATASTIIQPSVPTTTS